jgi:hypothetical protein
MSEETRKAFIDRTAAAAAKGEYEIYKTTTIFDGTSRSPQWLG